MTDLKVATFNLRNGIALDGWSSWPFRRVAAAEVVRGLDADLVGLQEAYGFQERSVLRRLPRYVAVGRGRNARGCGERVPVLLDRIRCTVVALDHRWFGATPHVAGSTIAGARAPRMATIAVVEVDGHTVQVVNTHLDEASAERRAASVEQLVGWLDPTLPRIVVGDLNATPEAPALAPLVAAGLRQALPVGAGGTRPGFDGRTDGRRIDHILVSEEIEVVGAEVAHLRPNGHMASDHWPIVATVRL